MALPARLLNSLRWRRLEKNPMVQAMQSPYEGEKGTPGWADRLSSFLEQELVRGFKGGEVIAEKLTEIATPKVLEKGQVLYSRGQVAASLYFIFKGRCELLDHDYKVIDVIKKHQSLGESPLAEPQAHRQYAVTARALERSYIAEVSYPHFEAIADKEIWKRLFVKVTQRLNQRRDEDAARPQVIVLVHGILTFAEWQPKLKAEFKEAGLETALTNFGLFDLIKFLMPGMLFRKKMIDKVKAQLDSVREHNPNARISILAHSFGSYIVAEMIAKVPNIKVHRLVFCGSIVPFDHPFIHQIGHRITDCVVNDVGTRDIWPALAKSITTGYGDTGTYGFRCHPKVTDRWFRGLGHSSFFEVPEFCKENWIPFFIGGEEWLGSVDAKKSPALFEKTPALLEKEEEKKREEDLVKKRVKELLPFWVYWVSLIKIKAVVPSVVVLGILIWWQWNYLIQLFKLT